MNKIEYIKIGKDVIRQEIGVLQSLENSLSDSFADALGLMLNCSGKIVLVGIGKNTPICEKMVATLNSTGTPAQFLHAAEAMHGDLGILSKNDVALVLSKSGNTKEIKNVLPHVKRLAGKVIGICADENSFLSKNADILLHTPVDQEAGPLNLAPTSSTTAQLVLCDALAVALKRIKKFTADQFSSFHPGGSLGKNLLFTVNDLMDKDQKPQVNWDSDIKEVIQSLTSGRYGITTVFRNDKIVGVITDGDLRRMLEKYSSFQNLKAIDIATPNPKSIRADVLARKALEMINKYAIGQLIVLDENDKYVGIIDFHRLTKEGIYAK